MVNSLIFNLVGCKAYIDDAIIFSEEWERHLQTIRNFFDRLSEATLTVNLTKSEFCHANLTFLGHMVGQGQVKPVEAKVEAIADFPRTFWQKTTDALSRYGWILQEIL